MAVGISRRMDTRVRVGSRVVARKEIDEDGQVGLLNDATNPAVEALGIVVLPWGGEFSSINELKSAFNCVVWVTLGLNISSRGDD